MDTRGVIRLGMPGDKRPVHKELNRFLAEYCGQWQAIGLHLGLTKPILNTIAADNPLKQRECFRVTLDKWLQMEPRATWSALELAITNANREELNLDSLEAMPPETGPAQPVPLQPVPQGSISSEILKKKPQMFDLIKIVIPRIMNEWEYVAYALRYDLATIKAIKDGGRENPKKCCEEFFTDWLTTKHGAEAGPKIWSTLLDALKEIDEISADITADITAKVLQLKK